MTRITALTGALLLTIGLAGCQPNGATVASWQTRCLTTEDIAAHAARSREGVSATCNESVRANATVLARGSDR